MKINLLSKNDFVKLLVIKCVCCLVKLRGVMYAENVPRTIQMFCFSSPLSYFSLWKTVN